MQQQAFGISQLKIVAMVERQENGGLEHRVLLFEMLKIGGKQSCQIFH
jgi:hypothetical protein